MPRGDLIQYRRGLAEEWAAADPVLADGEVGFDRTAVEIRVGDGTSPWSALDAIGGLSEDAIRAAINDYLASHPVEGVTAEYVQVALQSHREEAAPHTAYDVQIPSLSILFQNGLV